MAIGNAAFNAWSRDEIDLDTLSAELLAVVDQTMEPTMASSWLQPPMSALGDSRALSQNAAIRGPASPARAPVG
jgi:hypothetical protein